MSSALIGTDDVTGVAGVGLGTGAPVVGSTAVVVAAGAAAGDELPFMIFGSWNASSASRITPPAARMIFCFFAF